MERHLLYPADQKPSLRDIEQHIANPLWDSFTAFIEQAYGAAPKREVR